MTAYDDDMRADRFADTMMNRLVALHGPNREVSFMATADPMFPPDRPAPAE